MTRIYYSKIDDVKLIDINDFSESIRQHLLLKKNDVKYKESLAGWSLLHKVMPNIDFKKLVVTFNEYGKPECDGFFFNISHSKDLVCVGISNGLIGIDIEYIDLDKDISKLSLKLFGESSSNYDFYEKFTKMEAYVKYMGKSIGCPKCTLNDVIKNVNTIRIDNNNQGYSLSYLSDDLNIEFIKV